MMKTFALALALASVEAHGYGYATAAYPTAYPTYATAASSTMPHTHYQGSSYNSNYPYGQKSDPWGVNGTTKT